MTERDALLLACREHPDCDVRRLVYADWLDAQDTVSVPCPTCQGFGEFVRTGQQCHVCHGSGFVRDDLNGVKAEIIRVQCAYARHQYREKNCRFGIEYHGPVEGHDSRLGHPCPSCNPDSRPLVAREQHLLTAHRDRLFPVCAQCKGVPYPRYHELAPEGLPPCSTCAGTSRVGTFVRGLLEVVPVPTLVSVFNRVEIWNERNDIIGIEHELTTWAADLLRDFPTVRRMPVGDREPETWRGKYIWCGHPEGQGMAYFIPSFLFAALKAGEYMPQGYPEPGHIESMAYDTPDLARDALAVAVCEVARQMHEKAVPV